MSFGIRRKVERGQKNLNARRALQSGYTLLELMIVIGIVASMTVVTIEQKKNEFEIARAKKLGLELYTYNNAIRSYISTNAQSITSGQTIGVNALKSASQCGAPATGAQGYLSCAFGVTTQLGSLTYTTSFSVTGAWPSSTIVGTTRMPQLQLGGSPRIDLAGAAAMTAMGSQAAQLIPATSTTDGRVVAYTGTTGAPTDVAAVIEMTASNVPLNDPWLRTDGANTMNAPIRFGGSGAGHRSLIQAAAGDFLGLIGTNFTLSNTAFWTNVNTEIAAQLLVRQNATFLAATRFDGKATFTATGDAVEVTNGGVVISGVNAAGNSIDATGKIVTPGRVSASLVELSSFNTSGSSCSPDGSLSRDVNQTILICKSGAWKPATGDAPVAYGRLTSTAVMTAGTGASSTQFLGTGHYRVNLASSLGDTNYVVTCTPEAVSEERFCSSLPVSATTFDLYILRLTGGASHTPADAPVHFVVFDPNP